MQGFWQHAEEAVNRAHARVDAAARASRSLPHDATLKQEHLQAIRALHEAVERAWPPAFELALQHLQRGESDAADLDLLLGFLRAAPRFFRSGYMEERVLRVLPRVRWSPAQAEQLRDVVLHAVQRRHVRHFRRFCRLARHLDTPALYASLRTLQASEDPEVRRRARWMLSALSPRAMTEP